MIAKIPDGFEYIDHTADIGLRASGQDLNAAFVNAARGMFSIITDIRTVNPTSEFQLKLQAQDLEALLVAWLSELLYLHEVSRVMFCEFEVTLGFDLNNPDCHNPQDSIPNDKKVILKGIARGEDYDPDRHEYKTEIKAVTRHMLEVDEASQTITVLFDI